MKALSETDILTDITLNCNEIRSNIAVAAEKSGRKPGDIRFMAVTKTVAPEYINHAFSLGMNLMGENKVQELLSKLEFLKTDGVDIHIIGHLQSNKVRKIIDIVDMIESVDSLSLAREISLRAVNAGRIMDILIEVNIGDEEAKTGIDKNCLAELVKGVGELEGIRLRGFMAIPPVTETPEGARPYFAEMKKLFDEYRAQLGDAFDTLSMGMSSDYAVAIEEGANLVRVGSSLFGARRY